MEGSQPCTRCGAAFEPRREHARFCSAACHIAWNQEHADEPDAEDTALGWRAGSTAGRQIGQLGVIKVHMGQRSDSEWIMAVIVKQQTAL
jgi:hypothetical protein